MRLFVDDGWPADDAGRFSQAGQRARWPALRAMANPVGLAALCADSCLAERHNWFHFYPVAFAAGIGAYFLPAGEPTLAPVCLVAATALFTAWCRSGSFVASLVLWASLGFLAAALRTALVATPTVPYGLPAATVSGWVERIEQRPGHGRRLTIRVSSISHLAPDATPPRVRLVDRHPASNLLPGDAVAVQARLTPPAAPVRPRGHDFARALWFGGIGAVGFTFQPPRRVPLADGRPRDLAVTAAIARVRHRTAQALQASGLGGTDLVTALVTGDRAAISRERTDALRHAGLAHLLAISGLHMTLVAGTLFWLIRALLALLPGLAQRCDLRKAAACGALIGGAGYLALSGAAVPTQRAFVMMAVVFAAVLLDRPALTMRNLALAALLILVMRPESVLSAGFQMSFATVTALVAVYGAVAARRRRVPPRRGGPVRRAWRAVLATAFTTLVAGVATAPFAAYHFQTLAAYSIAANVVAVPVVAFIVMPAALMATLALPFGLEAPFLALAAAAADQIMGLAQWIASRPGAVVTVRPPALVAVVLVVAGGLWLCLWQRAWRWVGAVAVAAGLAFGQTRAPPPDVLVAEDGANLAVRNRDGELAVWHERRRVFAVERWLKADGDPADAVEAARRSGLRCDRYGCAAATGNGMRVAFVRSVAALAEECRSADIVIATLTVDRRHCSAPRIVIDRSDLRADGAHAVRVVGDAIMVESAASTRGARPWTRRTDYVRPKPRSATRRRPADVAIP